MLDGFHDFMCEKFRVLSNRGSYGIAEFYSQNQAEAVDLWFSCLEEFISKKDGTSDIEKYYAKRRTEDLFSATEQENSDLPPTPAWNKIIWFRTAHIQKEEKALEMFAEYFDEFAFQGKGYIENIESSWKNHLEHKKDCHIIKRWKNS